MSRVIKHLKNAKITHYINKEYILYYIVAKNTLPKFKILNDTHDT